MKTFKRTLAALLAAAILMQAAPAEMLLAQGYAEETAVQQTAEGEAQGAQQDDSESTAASSSEAASDSTPETSESEAASDSAENGDAAESEEVSSEAGSDSEPETGESEAASESAESEAQEDDRANRAALPREEDIAEQAAADATELQLSDLVEAKVITHSGDSITINQSHTVDNIEYSVADQLILLSNCDASDLKNKTITVNQTGTVDLAPKQDSDLKGVSYNGGTYFYKGIGSSDAPFAGSLTISVGNINFCAPFFGGLSSSATISVTGTLYWAGDGNVPMIADTYVMEGDGTAEHTLPIRVQAQAQTGGEQAATATMGSLLGTVRGGGTLAIGDVVNYTNASEVTASSSDGNAGLICNTLESGTIKITSDYTFPTKGYTVQAKDAASAADAGNAGNAGGLVGAVKSGTVIAEKSIIFPSQVLATGSAGGLVGYLAEGATLQINSTGSADASGLTVNAQNGSAGGLVGTMRDGATVELENGATITLNKPNVTGGDSAGGVVGYAQNAVFTGDTNAIKVSAPTAKGAYAGGFIGRNNITKATDASAPHTMPECVNLTDSITVGGSYAGGYFGWLELGSEKLQFTFGEEGNSSKELTVANTDASDLAGITASAYGGIAGKITSENIASTVLMQNITVKAIYNANGGNHGGLVGELGDEDSNAVYLETNNMAASGTNSNNGAWFGGFVGVLQKGSILDVTGTATVTTSGNITKGGGLVGQANEGGAVRLAGTTDFSSANYGGITATLGWLLGKTTAP